MITDRKVKERRIKRCYKKYATQIGVVRLLVKRTSKHIYAILFDNTEGRVITSASSLSPEIRDKIKGLKKTEVAKIVGQILAERAKAKGIEHVVFDRHGYKYHGRVKAVAEGAREGGLVF
ncbi:MAG: 50S ribosomal protein L18 [bacterium]